METRDSSSVQGPSPARSAYWDRDVATGAVAWAGLPAPGLAIRAPAEVVARGWWDAKIHTDDLPRLGPELAALERGVATHAELKYRVRDDEGRWIDIRDRVVTVEHGGRVARLIGTVEPALASGEAPDPPAHPLHAHVGRFQALVDGLPLLAWEADAEGWIDYYNQRWFDYTGTTPEEMQGWGWARVHDPMDLPRMLKVWRRALLTGIPWEDEFKLRRGSDGMYRWHLSRATPLRDEHGTIVRWFGTNTDIHDQKLALEERERLLSIEQSLRRQAEAASREKDEFLAVVSHELRSPLSAVLGWAHLLGSGGLPADRTAEAASKIERNARSLERLIADLLDVSRIISGKLQIERVAVSLTQAVERAVEVLRDDARGAGVAVCVTPALGDDRVLGDIERIQQIVVNLVSNAVKFTSAGREVAVEIETPPGEVVVRVRDQGEGIEPEFLPRLFRRFDQADASSRRAHGGLGLGLSIVHHLVGLHDGSVSATSDGKGKGATFEVRLPAFTGPPSLPFEDVPSRARASVSLAGLRVLGVDDEPEARDLLASILLAAGATVTLTGSVAATIDQLRIGTPDIIVTDLAMPQIDGYGLVERVRAFADPAVATLPIVALTAHASAQDRAKCLASGFDAYMSKPFDAIELCTTIKRLAARNLGR